jgi:hypothetical protein
MGSQGILERDSFCWVSRGSEEGFTGYPGATKDVKGTPNPFWEPYDSLLGNLRIPRAPPFFGTPMNPCLGLGIGSIVSLLPIPRIPRVPIDLFLENPYYQSLRVPKRWFFPLLSYSLLSFGRGLSRPFFLLGIPRDS